MKVDLIAPSEKLAPYVKTYFFVRDERKKGLDLRLKLFPVGNPQIIFYRKGNVTSYINGVRFDCDLPTLSGQIMRYFEIDLAPQTKFAGITFFPTAMYKLLGVDARKVMNRIDPINFFLNEPDYIHKASGAQSDEDFIQAHEDFLLNKLQTVCSLPPVVDQCIADIYSAKGNIQVDTLAQNYNCSRRYLEKHFSYAIGVSPGKYAKRIRFFNVMKKIVIEKVSTEKILAEFNYYDRSHFLKDFEYFMGEKAQSYFGSNRHPFMNILIREDALLMQGKRM